MKSTVSLASRVAFSSARNAFTASGDKPLGAAVTTVCGCGFVCFGRRISARVGGFGVVLHVMPLIDFSHSVVVPPCCPNAGHTATSKTRARIAIILFMDALLVQPICEYSVQFAAGRVSVGPAISA